MSATSAPSPATVFSLWPNASGEATQLALAIARLRTPDLDVAASDPRHPAHAEALALAIVEAKAPPPANASISVLPAEAHLAPISNAPVRATAPSFSDLLRDLGLTNEAAEGSQKPRVVASHALWPLLLGIALVSLTVFISIGGKWKVEPIAPSPSTSGLGPAPVNNVGPLDPRPETRDSKPTRPGTRTPAPPTVVEVPISVEPATARLLVDGQEVDPRLGRVSMSTGSHRFALSHIGYLEFSQLLHVGADATPLTLTMRPDPTFRVAGSWAGDFDEKPLSLQVTPGSMSGGTMPLTVHAKVDLGDGETQEFALTGTIELATRIVHLKDDTKGYSFSGTLSPLGDGSRRMSGEARRENVDYAYRWWATLR